MEGPLASKRSTATENNQEVLMFRHTELPSKKSIRILTLLGSTSRDDPIHCLLTTNKFIEHKHPNYTALSYAWGSADRSASIFVNGLRMIVTHNLWEALVHLRTIQAHAGDVGPMWWIDSICIDQENGIERGHQVSMMRQIYEKATLVVAWLGPELHDSCLATQTADRIGTEATEEEILALIRSKFYDTLLLRPYWTRLWIIQELCVAKQVLLAYGNETIPWDIFSQSLQALNKEDPYVFQAELYGARLPVLIPFHLRDLITRYQASRMTLPLLLILTKQSECTDRRDRVFSLLGLAHDAPANQMVPDYTMSACEVFCSAIRIMFPTLLQRDDTGTVREMLALCKHDPMVVDVIARSACDGMGCNAWNCCFNVAGMSAMMNELDKGDETVRISQLGQALQDVFSRMMDG